MTIKAGILGATGYAGVELCRLLLRHPGVELAAVGSVSFEGKKLYEVYPNLRELCGLECENTDAVIAAADVVFAALPHGLSQETAAVCAALGKKFIDLGADFRLDDGEEYQKWYGCEAVHPELHQRAVYGLPELFREEIKNTDMIGNPGCYPTCSTLSIYPLLKEGLIDPSTVIIDAKSGTSGAGRGAKVDNLYCEVNENIKAYGVANHRHTPEIEEQLSLAAGEEMLINFTPHLVPMNRGILITAYASLKSTLQPDGTRAFPSYEEVRAAYDKYYDKEKFVRVLDKNVCPETKWVEGSNYVDVNFKIDERTGRVIMMGAMDNLVKGAAGQAVQNMNLMFGLPETKGLELVPMFP